MHISLVAGRKSRGYARYSLLYFPLLFFLIGRYSRRWSPGAGVPDADHRNVKIPGAFYDTEFPLNQE